MCCRNRPQTITNGAARIAFQESSSWPMLRRLAPGLTARTSGSRSRSGSRSIRARISTSESLRYFHAGGGGSSCPSVSRRPGKPKRSMNLRISPGAMGRCFKSTIWNRRASLFEKALSGARGCEFFTPKIWTVRFREDAVSPTTVG